MDHPDQNLEQPSLWIKDDYLYLACIEYPRKVCVHRYGLLTNQWEKCVAERQMQRRVELSTASVMDKLVLTVDAECFEFDPDFLEWKLMDLKLPTDGVIKMSLRNALETEIVVFPVETTDSSELL